VRDEHPRLRGGRARQGSRTEVRRRRASQYSTSQASLSSSTLLVLRRVVCLTFFFPVGTGFFSRNNSARTVFFSHFQLSLRPGFLVPTCPRPRRLQCLRALICSQSLVVYLKEKGSQISGQKYSCTPLISLLESEVFAIGDIRAEQCCTQF